MFAENEKDTEKTETSVANDEDGNDDKIWEDADKDSTDILPSHNNNEDEDEDSTTATER